MLLQQQPQSHGGHQSSSLSRVGGNHHHAVLAAGQDDSSDDEDKLDVGEASDLRPDGLLDRARSLGRIGCTFLIRQTSFKSWENPLLNSIDLIVSYESMVNQSLSLQTADRIPLQLNNMPSLSSLSDHGISWYIMCSCYLCV